VRQFVLVRHGQSEFNAQNRFTGWVDSPLTALGEQEAHRAGAVLGTSGFRFDRIYCSALTRCTESARIIREELCEPTLPIIMSWRLNERHYGALQGLDKAETTNRFGEPQVTLWRRSYDVRPPPSDAQDNRDLEQDPRYAALEAADFPLTESLADTIQRVLPYWTAKIAPAIRYGQSVLVVAHGNSIRALIKYLDNLSAAEIVDVNVPTGIPQVYELTDDMRPMRHYYLNGGR
jgi:2,3-bisphosphoglycerate-dependent phosphoglycerate mutase